MVRLACKKVQKKVEEELKAKTDLLISKGNRAPSLAVIMVGDNGASLTYVKNKEDACTRLGFMHFDYRFSEDVREDELLNLIDELNKRDDVDGFSPINVGRLSLEEECFIPCTPKGILEILKYYNIETRGKKAVVIGRSNIVGKPMAMLLMQKGIDATVSVCNSHTKDLSSYTKDADIIIVATGKVNTLNSSMCKNDAVIIDVGVNRIADSTREKGFYLKGDVDYDSFADTDCQITPVPGGVGLMTVIELMENTYLSCI